MALYQILPEVCPLFDRTDTILGKISPTCASFPEVSLEMRPPREFSLGFGTIKASFWRYTKLLPEASPAFDRTEAILGEIVFTYASLPEVSLEMRPPREFCLGFGTIKVYFWRCSDLLPEVSPVFDRTEAFHGEIFPTYASLPEVSLEIRPPVSSLSGSVPPRHRFGAVVTTYASPPKISLEMRPPVSSLSGSVPSRPIFGAVAIYYRKSLQYLIVQKLFLGKSFPHTPAFQRCLWKCIPP